MNSPARTIESYRSGGYISIALFNFCISLMIKKFPRAGRGNENSEVVALVPERDRPLHHGSSNVLKGHLLNRLDQETPCLHIIHDLVDKVWVLFGRGRLGNDFPEAVVVASRVALTKGNLLPGFGQPWVGDDVLLKEKEIAAEFRVVVMDPEPIVLKADIVCREDGP